jgi:hypothetical protein
MPENNQKTRVSRREFLKQTLKTTGYVIPTVMVFKLGSADVWAESYGDRGKKCKNNDNDSCNSNWERVFNPHCWFR